MGTRIMVLAAIALAASYLAAAPTTAPVSRPVTSKATSTATSTAASAPAAVDIKGVKVLVAFDLEGPPGSGAGINRRTDLVAKALAAAGAKVVKETRPGYYVLDVAGKKPEDVVKTLPFQQGAIVFKDGNFDRAISVRSTDGKTLEPRPQAARTFGAGFSNVQAMRHESAALSSIPGVKAENVAARGEPGAAFKIVLTPKTGTTLLEVFVLTEGQFDYRVMGGDDDTP